MTELQPILPPLVQSGPSAPQYQMLALSRLYLREHGLAVLCDHGALVTVQGHKVVVEGFFGVLQDVIELGGAPFEDAAEVARNQGPADRCVGATDKRGASHTNETKQSSSRRKGAESICSVDLLYLLGPSSRQKVMVNMASSSKNSVVNASHHRLSHSW